MMPSRNCERCGSEMEMRKPSSPTRFCSRTCANRSRDPSTIKGTFSKGLKPWNAGLKAWRKNYSHSAETRRRISEAISGERGSNWKGGVSPENERLRKTAAYKAWRTAVFDRDAYTCRQCGDRSRVGHRVTLHADHIQPFASFPELRFDVSNGRTLCAPCHRKTPTFGAWKVERFTGQTAVLATEE